MPNQQEVRVTLGRVEAARSLGVSLRKVDELIAGAPENGFPIFREGRRVLIPVRKLEQWAADRVEGQS